ncbi:uncharacterized protein KIAA2013 homolog [Eurytemora carolleeae]|uniref:uncharacterized protein KIAA2013 homolog n=1 Tax=Eurytemora carolleeae TaxID=1294199 RepID=UPI000C76B4D1|nr:uncharacterized protein KIAA2013 homolog [Eurytemora carolleeae]|eukprot:XP_023319855.1 uncharacterized protein KIAA2013 homolog [Eurytemora affinis]
MIHQSPRDWIYQHFFGINRSINGLKMVDLLELGRRGKRSLDGNISYRKAGLLVFILLVFFYYIGSGSIRWFLGRKGPPVLQPLPSCLASKLLRYQDILDSYNGHRSGEDFISFVGNGNIGLSVNAASEIYIKSKRTLSLAVNFKPLVSVYLEGGGEQESVQVQLHPELDLVFRTIPGVLVQELKIHNPGEYPAQLSVEKLGISQWDGATSQTKVIEHGEGGQKYSLVTGEVTSESRRMMVSVVSKRLDSSIEIAPRMTTSLRILTGVAYREVNSHESLRKEMEKEAVEGVKSALAMTWQSLIDAHTEAWRKLWTTGFGISWSYAEGAVNGNRVNATIYYVLSHSPSLLLHNTPQYKMTELQGYLSYAEGCYSGVRTLEAPNLWTSLATLKEAVTVVSYWLLTLEKNGCHYLLKAGADGVVQAMVLSLPGLKFSNQHLELDVHPRELHRDIMLRRVNYGNETHINISINVMDDNRAALFVSMDKKNRDYYGCDAGCLDPPVQLGLVPVQFPVKLTDPVTAILYITADQEHMMDLKHTIHVKEVVEAPAHQPHVLELHRSGNKLGGLPVIFWISIASLIIVFHLFLFKLIYNEYCAGQEKQRIRKHSDYN